MDGFVHPRRRRAEGGGRHDAYAAHQRRREIGEYVAEHIRGDDDIEPRRIAHELHGGVVHIHAVHGDGGVVLVDVGDHLPPQRGRGEHIGFVDEAQPAPALFGEFVGYARHALDLYLGVAFGVERLSAELPAAVSALPEIYPARELADDDEIYAAREDVGTERRSSRKRGIEPGGPEICVEPQAFAYAEQGGFGTHGSVVPLGTAHRSEQHRVGGERRFRRGLGKGSPDGVYRRSADERVAHRELVSEPFADGCEHAFCRGDYLGTYAVSRQSEYACFHFSASSNPPFSSTLRT